ncbi:carbohydrate kinase family protein [Pectinatus sottacetonis]|uniref:carbohydrate kinase family protein n=1 Tax=Pectinatus sottacetonis TaxID=1002795 RepID=UPI0018C80298|nr:carbohydrate kinase [Pectinatus sottacetonis]
MKYENNIAVYGEALIDFTYENNGYVPHPGGSPYNVAIGLGRLGINVAYCTQLSKDMFGRLLYNYLQENNVNVQHIKFTDKPTTLTFVKIADNGEPQYAVYSNGAADVEISKADFPKPEINARIHHFGSISIEQNPCGQVWENYIKQLREFVSFDPNIRANLIKDRELYLQRFNNILLNTDLLKLSDEDLLWLAPSKKVDEFVQDVISYGVKAVAITKGSKGVQFYYNGKIYNQAALAVPIADTVGAGDTFSAAFLMKLLPCIKNKFFVDLNDNVVINALKTGVIAAALNCCKRGANPPTISELKIKNL